MLSPTERIGKLEEQMLELRGMLQTIGALPITVLQAALDQMVDEQLLPAATRTEIFGRIRKELAAFSAGSDELARGAKRALPHYPTAVEREETKQRRLHWQRQEEEMRREILSPRPAKPDTDQ